MGVVTVSSSVSRSPLGLTTRLRSRHPSVQKAHFLAFKSDNSKSSGFVTTKDSLKIPTESTAKKSQNSLKRTKKKLKKVKAVATEEASPSTSDLDYDTLAATLENIYKLSPDILSDSEDTDVITTRSRRPRKAKTSDREKNTKDKGIIVRNKKKRARLSLDKRMALKDVNVKRVVGGEDVDRLLRDYSASTNLASLDWKKMKIPAVLSSSEHTWLFKLMQPVKSILEVKENLHVELDREPTDREFAASINMNTSEMRKQIQIGRAARNKLIKHNLRLVLFVINKYYQDLGNGPKFQDLCQAGVKGLIMAIDRFEQKRGFRLSTYALFWIRHAIIRSMTVSSFTRVPFGIESVKQEIQKTKLELMFDLGRQPTEEEIIERLGISPNRYRDIVRASKQVLSLHSRHSVTQEEFIKGITDVEGVGDDKHRQSALLRLALDDVLDSLKPKENLVIRQRYGLDGKGDRTLGEIAGNLNISREMVRKHEMKALMKLKHPARVDYLRRHIT